jgi:hypothetical protein
MKPSGSHTLAETQHFIIGMLEVGKRVLSWKTWHSVLPELCYEVDAVSANQCCLDLWMRNGMFFCLLFLSVQGLPMSDPVCGHLSDSLGKLEARKRS